jgi:hypothetical protein
VLAFYGSAITPHLARLQDGSLLCRGAILCRTGVQEYLPSEITDGPLPEGTRMRNGLVSVLRPASEVLNKTTQASLEGLTVTGPGHPPTFISPTNWKTWTAGHLQHIRQGPDLPSGEQTLAGDIVVQDGALADAVERGDVREISLGYQCKYEPQEDGSLIQTDIIGNHLAILRRGRGGEAVRIYDHALQPVTVEAKLQRFGRMLARASERDPEIAVAGFRFLEEAIAEMTDAVPVSAAVEYAEACRQFHRRPL